VTTLQHDRPSQVSLHLGETVVQLSLTALFFAVVFGATFFLFHQQVYAARPFGTGPQGRGMYLSDLPAHLGIAQSVAAGGPYVPHSGFHRTILALSSLSGLSLADSAVVVLASFVTLLALTIYMALHRTLASTHLPGLVLFLTAAMMLVAAIYVPFFNSKVYLGQGSPNVWHNPTILAAKPFALISFLFCCRYFEAQGPQRRVWWIAIAALALLISVFMKPNFALVFAPALAATLILTGPKNHKAYLSGLLIVLPAVLALAYQYWRMRALGGTIQGPINFRLDMFALWRQWSPNVAISLLLALAFPLSVLLLRWRQAIRSFSWLLAWIMTVVGILQFGLLAIDGPFYGAGDWSWGYLFALQILFLVSIIEFFRWSDSVSRDRLATRICATAVCVVFSLHLVAGIYYFGYMMSGGIFW
jgi:hypothetical protein